MESILVATQIILSIALSLIVLTQQRGAGLSATFGGQGGGFHSAKRGAEKVLSNITIALVILFVLNSLAFLFV